MQDPRVPAIASSGSERGVSVRDFKDCVPADAREHYNNLFKERTKAERNKYNAKIQAIRNQTAAQSVRSSGHADKASWEAKAEQLDGLAIGCVEDVLEVYRERELALTPAICSCLAETAREYLDTVYRNQLKISGDGMPGFSLLNSSIQEMPTRKFAALPRINVLIERARLASVKKKTETPGSMTVNHTYQITQNVSGSHNNVAAMGDIAAHQQYNFNQLAVELESLRKELSQHPNVDVGDLKLLEEAEQAAKQNDETRLQRVLKKVKGGTWEIVSGSGLEVGKQLLIGYIKAKFHLPYLS
jgi:hypothetical protein